MKTPALSQIKTITIVGLGLMGGSLAAILRKKMPRVHIVGVSRNQKAIKKAVREKWIHEGFCEISRGVRSADLIILCTPVQTFAGLLKEVMFSAPKGALVTDVGSVKMNILRQAPRTLSKKVHYISAHPMVGSHVRGIDAVNSKLYDQGFAFVIRDKHVSPQAYRCVKSFWALVMPRVIEISAAQHDRITAQISHGPHALSACLMHAVDAKALSFAASGFRDATRLAAGSPEIWLPIFEANRAEVALSLDRIIRQIQRFKKALKSKSHKDLRTYLSLAEGKRKRL